MSQIPVRLAVEGYLDEQVLRQLVKQSGKPFTAGVCYGKRGKDHLCDNVKRFNFAARHVPFIILTDLDNEECSPGLIKRLLPESRSQNLLLRVAVHEVEAWLLADRQRMAEFLGVPAAKIPSQPDDCKDPKTVLVGLARMSRRRDIRDDLVPAHLSTSKVGKNYTGRLTQFVTTKWRVNGLARKNSPSLDKALQALEQFSPTIVK
ncbi:hypothetical protein EDS67_28165 [candidate division KSB1 bacterium]|nr:MAG: hypothetical protein EDS67_28165 [candidate division KSB1 bacterium]MBC6951051.1 hypothetical protein [candidate division KSB1 bacterium]MCE7945138.1 hypothetical protein [Chlorobi bacterium CHB1]MDL1876931.1 hypothetical protein [Cytophagia bacterium CHB2]